MASRRPRTMLNEARMPDGSQRFYPPFEHPAIRKMVELRDRLKPFALAAPVLVRSDDLATLNMLRAFKWANERINAFETGEAHAKAAFLERVRLRDEEEG